MSPWHCRVPRQERSNWRHRTARHSQSATGSREARRVVQHVDQVQILVKWDDGRSESLRPDFADRLRIIEDE